MRKKAGATPLNMSMMSMIYAILVLVGGQPSVSGRKPICWYGWGGSLVTLSSRFGDECMRTFPWPWNASHGEKHLEWNAMAGRCNADEIHRERQTILRAAVLC